MELKLTLNKENLIDVAYLASVLLAVIIAAFGKVAIGGAIGLVLILAVTLVSFFLKKQ